MLHPTPWSGLTDEDLERELFHAHEKRNDMFVGGTASAWANLLERTAQLEVEYLHRFPDRVAEVDAKRALYQSDTTRSTD